MASCFMHLELDWTVVYGDGEVMALQLTVVMVFPLRFCVSAKFLTH
jgi:hypothetical protein